MKIAFIASLAGALFLLPLAAQAEEAFTTDDAMLRAGPGHDYPPIETLPPDVRVFLHGCIDRFEWCDVSAGPERGWMHGDRLYVPWHGHREHIIAVGPELRLPILAFNFDSYWDEHYHGRDFYRERERWREHRGEERHEEHRDHERERWEHEHHD